METIILSSIVNFVVMVSILYFAARKPMAKFLANRSETIATEMVEAEKISSEAKRELGKWQNSWSSTEAQMQSARTDAESSLERTRKGALESAKVQGERIRQDSKRIAQSEVARAKENLEREILTKSVEVAGRYLGRNINEEDRHKLVNEYVEKVAHGKA